MTNKQIEELWPEFKKWMRDRYHYQTADNQWLLKLWYQFLEEKYNQEFVLKENLKKAFGLEYGTLEVGKGEPQGTIVYGSEFHQIPECGRYSPLKRPFFSKKFGLFRR